MIGHPLGVAPAQASLERVLLDGEDRLQVVSQARAVRLDLETGLDRLDGEEGIPDGEDGRQVVSRARVVLLDHGALESQVRDLLEDGDILDGVQVGFGSHQVEKGARANLVQAGAVERVVNPRARREDLIGV